jgi:hypothetical protein
MKALVLTSLFFLYGAALFAQSSTVTSGTETAINAAIKNYFDGYLTGDLTKLAAAFDTTSGTMHRLKPSDKTDTVIQMRDAVRIWATSAKTKPYSPEDIGRSSYKILSSDILNDELAVVKVDIQFGARRYIDYLSLYHVRGDWKIVNKVFVVMP